VISEISLADDINSVNVDSFVLDTVVFGKFTITETQRRNNGLTSINPEPVEYNKDELTNYLIRRTEEAYREAANNQHRLWVSEREGKQLQGLLEGFVDISYFANRQDAYAPAFVAKNPNVPNLRLRVGGTWYWLKGFISNNLFRVERVTEDGTLSSPRDLAAAYFLSNKTIRIQPLDPTGETIFVYYDPNSSDNLRDVYRGTMVDGTLISLMHFKTR